MAAPAYAGITCPGLPDNSFVSADVRQKNAQDGGANGNTAAAQASSSFDGSAPTVAISGVPD